jgi:tripartite-type tricarboxylate transporter receptor subunit TctC
LVKLARAQPGKLSYATSGVGTVLHLAMERVKALAGIDIVHVPYKGGAQIVSDLIGSQVDLAMLVTVATLPQVKAGKVKALGITLPQRLAMAPEIPALAESPELRGFDMVAWTGLFAPARTPAPIIERLGRELNDALASPEVGGKYEEQGAVLRRYTPAEFARFLRKEQADYEAIVRAAGIREQ